MNNKAELDNLGNQFRLAVRELYASMKDNKTLRANYNDISDFAKSYIPEGTSFDDAECILRRAGFDVHERPDANVPGDPNWPNKSDRYDVFATMLLASGFLPGVKLMLGMRPKSPGDYSTVKEVRAAIIVTYP